MSVIRVLIVDDHPIVRVGISDLLQKVPDIQVVGEVSQGDEVLAQVRDLSPDVVLLDVELPGLNGMQVAQQLRGEKPGVRILAISAHD